jgi:cytochrome c-type biogenesis protein
VLDIILAFAAGVFTIAAPCVLPMLPIILGASLGHCSSMRPISITTGFAATDVGPFDNFLLHGYRQSHS